MRPPTVCVNRTQPSPSFRLGLDHRELDGGEGDLLRLELGPVADQASAGLAVVDDLVAVDLDPGAKLVGLAERILAAKLVEVGNDLGRRLVVVRDSELERDRRAIRSSASNGSQVIAVAEASMRIAPNNTGDVTGWTPLDHRADAHTSSRTEYVITTPCVLLHGARPGENIALEPARHLGRRRARA